MSTAAPTTTSTPERRGATARLASLAGPVVIAIAVQSLANLLFHAVLGRSLPAAEYGALGTVLAAAQPGEHLGNDAPIRRLVLCEQDRGPGRQSQGAPLILGRRHVQRRSGQLLAPPRQRDGGAGQRGTAGQRGRHQNDQADVRPRRQDPLRVGDVRGDRDLEVHRRALGRLRYRDPEPAQRVHHRRDRHRVSLHGSGDPRWPGLVLLRRGRPDKADHERAALAEPAAHLDAAAQRGGEAVGDRHSQPGAAVRLLHRPSLGVLLEDGGQRCLGHPGSGVFDCDDEVGALLAGGHRHNARRGELHRVGHNVEQHLAQSPGVGPDPLPQIGRGADQQRQLLGLGDRAHHRGDLLDQGADRDLLHAQFQPARVGALQVEDIVQHVGQVSGGELHGADELTGCCVERLLQQEVDDADEADHGGAHIVAHHREQPPAPRHLQLGLGPRPPLRRDVAVAPGPLLRAGRRAAEQALPQGDPPVRELHRAPGPLRIRGSRVLQIRGIGGRIGGELREAPQHFRRVRPDE
jgi:hypothetical protein